MSALHALTHEPVRDSRGRRVFRASCACMPPGSFWFAARLPELFERHQAHLDALHAASRANHPAWRDRG